MGRFKEYTPLWYTAYASRCSKLIGNLASLRILISSTFCHVYGNNHFSFMLSFGLLSRRCPTYYVELHRKIVAKSYPFRLGQRILINLDCQYA